MGGCYLLAHGLATPVPKARTTVSVPRKGKWYVLVHNRDWCPWDWAAPGCFKVRVNGQVLESAFGQQNEERHWEAGGEIEISDPGKITLELEDVMPSI